jgi:adenylate cyclase
MLETCRAVFRERIQAHRGRVVDMAGDSILAVFETATGAVRAAFEVQTALAEPNEALPEMRRMHFRIGVNLGEVIERPDGTVYGDGVNIAARLESIGEPGGVTVSGTVFDQVKNRVQLGFDFIGEQQVKNIAELVRVYRVVAKGSPGSASTAALPLPAQPSIAVLPFQNMGGDSAEDWYADGLTETLITDLSKLRHLFVIARNSSFTYKGKAVDARQVGRELGVRYLL